MALFGLTSVTLKSALAIGGSTVGAGGMVGLAYSTPTILWQTGITCMVVDIEGNDASKLSPGLYMKFKDGYASVDKAMKASGGKAVCYKR